MLHRVHWADSEIKEDNGHNYVASYSFGEKNQRVNQSGSLTRS